MRLKLVCFRLYERFILVLGDESPAVVLPSIVGRLRSTFDHATYVGSAAQAKRGILKLSYPIEHGVIINMSDMTLVWKDAFDELKCDPEMQPVLMTGNLSCCQTWT